MTETQPEGGEDVERAEEQGGYGSPTPEQEMGEDQEGGGLAGEGGSAEGDEGMPGEPTD
ncbi:hypothetical protein [Sinomonas sp.]|uniref:hypothetical protein n=1 Tax=Sinomonas sp. TaxID=1914986 RepID=UPI003F7D8815